MEYKIISANLIDSLPEKHQKVLDRRFGLSSGEKETLESIGKDFGITRERVRQIEKDAFRRMDQESREAKKAFMQFTTYLRKHGGAKREDIILSNVAIPGDEKYASLLLNLGQEFTFNPERHDLHAYWALEKSIADRVEGILKDIIGFFEKEKAVKANLDHDEDPKLFDSSLEISKKVEKSPLGEFGLAKWPEVKPKGVRDRAYLTLKREGKPLHFRDIAEKSSKLRGDVCDEKKVYPQTVHNELIKDDRFILVGRGIYALSEWGYKPGTVKDVVLEILKKEGPLTKDEIIEKVKDVRIVKDNTVFLNLQNKEVFKKEGNKYTIK